MTPLRSCQDIPVPLRFDQSGAIARQNLPARPSWLVLAESIQRAVGSDWSVRSLAEQGLMYEREQVWEQLNLR
jgi:hypothetical protein